MSLSALDAWFGEISGKGPVGIYESDKSSDGWSGQSNEAGNSANSWSSSAGTARPEMLMIEDDTDRVVMGGVTMVLGGGPVNMGMALMYNEYNDAFGNPVLKTEPNDV